MMRERGEREINGKERREEEESNKYCKQGKREWCLKTKSVNRDDDYE